MTQETNEKPLIQEGPHSINDLWDNIESVPLEKIQWWPDLFQLYRFPDGRYWAILDGKLENQFAALEESVGLDTLHLEEAFSLLSRISADDLKVVLKAVRESEKHQNNREDKDTLLIDVSDHLRDTLTNAIESVVHVLDAIGSDLHQMRYIQNRMNNTKTSKHMISSFRMAVKAWKNRYIKQNKRPGRPKFYSYKNIEKGSPIRKTLPYFAILFAKWWVEKYQELPKKANVRANLVSAFPSLEGRKDSFWTNLYHKAGLSSLDSAMPWGKPS